ncbi:protein of unknown function [bacterium A37T11]|nr:protein of unknown function [bacterium A37T11]
MSFKSSFLLFSFLAFVPAAQAQKKKKEKIEKSPEQTLVYNNVDYLPVIKSVECNPQGQEQGFPLIHLNSEETLSIAFDDLRADNRNYYFSIEHCNASWGSSNLNSLEYMDGFNSDRIYQFEGSVNTLKPYTHYSFTFPSKNLKPKLAGNYLLKVYEGGSESRLVITRRIYVLDEKAALQVQILPSIEVTKRMTNQKLNVSVNTGSLRLTNPFQDIKLQVMQNGRQDVQEILTRPMYVQDNLLQYFNNKTLDFQAGNEFRFVDLRSLRLKSERVASLYRDSQVTVNLVTDHDQSTEKYTSSFDENGAFYIRNQDMDQQLNSADYAKVTFSLDIPRQTDGDIYLVGAFNSYIRNQENRLIYSPENNRYEVTLWLKQGLYDYSYSYVNSAGDLDPQRINGNHFETGNNYQVLCYFRKPGTTWDVLVGFNNSTTKKSTNII